LDGKSIGRTEIAKRGGKLSQHGEQIFGKQVVDGRHGGQGRDWYLRLIRRWALEAF
jgi:hypothetical protein